MGGYTLSSQAAGTVDYSAITSAIGSSFGAIVTNCVSVLTTVLPIGLGIFSMYVIIAFSKRVFKQITSK
jgi:hypothetical protein